MENWSTFESLCTAAADEGFDGRIIFGAGNQVGTRTAALADAGETPDVPTRYFGDIDAGGIRAARLAVVARKEYGWPPVEPSRALYELALATPHRLAGQATGAESAAWASDWFSGELGLRIGRCLSRGEIIRQESVGLEIIRIISFDSLLSEDSDLRSRTGSWPPCSR